MPPRQTRRSRGASRATATRSTRSRRPSTPPAQPEDDGDSQDDAAAVEEEPQSSPKPGDPDDEEGSSPAQGGGEEADASEPASEKQRQTPSRRKPGRPPKPRPLGWNTPEPGADYGSESGTPARRGRGRGRPGGWRGGFRGRARRGVGPSTTARQPTDENQNVLPVENDEAVLPEHSEGEKKVDKDGYLQAGREYRVRTFTILGRGRRLYMLSTEPARCTGFRDSYLFFTKHTALYKIVIDDDEKKDLIEREVLPHSYKGRPIGVVTARSVYREFGSKIVVGGKKVIDDYNPDLAKARGDIEGELADPFDRLPDQGQEYNRNQYVAWYGASSVYHSNVPNAPLPVGALAGRRRGAITSANWMFEHAREASRFNSNLAAMRRQTLSGAYEPHTNLMCYPRNMQPTQAVWEEVDDTDENPPPKKRRMNGFNGRPETLTNGVHDEYGEEENTHKLPKKSSGLLQPSSFLKRNYLVIDTHLYTAPQASLPPPGYRILKKREGSNSEVEMDDYSFDTTVDAGLRPPGLPLLSNDDLGQFSPTVRVAYERAKEMEALWYDVWNVPGAFHRPKIGISTQ